MKRNGMLFLVMIVLLVVLGISLWATSQFQDVRSRAAHQETVTIPTVVPAPKTLLTAPYIRLVSNGHQTYSTGDQVPLEIFIDTHSQPTSEARFVIAYDSNLLGFDEQGIGNGDIYPVLNVESVTPGKVIFSIFVESEAGYTPAILSQEQKVATLFFHVIGKGNTDTDVSLVVNPTSDETTSLSLFAADRSSPIQNILQSVEGTTISLR